MHRLPSAPSPSSSLCARCIRRRPAVPRLHRQSAFLPQHRSQPSSTPTEVSSKRNLSQLASPVGSYPGADWNTLLHSNPPTESISPSFPGITHDVLDKMFERSPLWQTSQERQLISPTINTADPEGVQKYLLQGSPVPKNTVELLTVLDALIAQDDLGRAAMVVASLKKQLDPGTPLSTLVYNKYLEGVISSSIQNSAGIGKAMDWFHDMANDGVKADRTTYALLSKAALSLGSVQDGNRAARKVFGLWRNQGGEIGDLLCDLMFPQEEISRSLKLNKLSLEDVSDGYRTVLELVIKTVKQTQTLLPENQVGHTTELPAIRKTLTKSPNLEFMRKSLEILLADDPKALEKASEELESHSESPEVFNDSYSMARQRQLEEGVHASALEVWKHELKASMKRGDGAANSRLGMQGLAYNWVQAMKPRLENHINNARPRDINSEGRETVPSIEKDTDPSRLDHIWLSALPIETLCGITVIEIIRASTNETKTMSNKASNLIQAIGRAVEKEMRASDVVRKENRGMHPKSVNVRRLILHNTRTADIYARRFHKELLQSKSGATHWPFEWRLDVRARCAAVLLSSFLETAMVQMLHTDENGVKHSQIAPAFYHTYAYVSGKKVGLVKPNKYVAERLASGPSNTLGLICKNAPMLVPPKQWTSWDEGGYWYTREEVMRTRNSLEQRVYLKEASEAGQLHEIYCGLDILGETCWTINRKVFEVALNVWNSGEAVADIPLPPSELQYPEQPKAASWDVKARIDWIQECRTMSRTMQNAHSLRCDLNYKLEVARAFLGKRLYFPHSLDFRGRAYPVPPHFNHLGNDLSRGLLLFHEGKPLGERGLRWLRIHLANVYGLDKMKLDEREEFAMNSLDNIFDSADHPLDGKRWWLNADDPWQCLATCMELTAALRSEDPTKYICHLPVHQDGSCNGLQHYAALGGDLEGAKQVNLEPSDRPQDVYSGVAQLVAADVEKQAAEGNEVAKALVGKISRKIVKQTVMTNVYGVTFVGAKAQIFKALKDKGELDISLLNHAADLIARSTFNRLADMFRGAHEIQEWLKECARRISKSLGPKDFLDKKPSMSLPLLTSVVWTTPLGLPVCQPYRKFETKSIGTLLTNVYLSNPNSIGPINVRKQMTAFPPNFIHSLDASHMLKSAIACDKAGLTFAAVHDSFWTHACDVDTLNVVLREAFIRMHSGDLIEKLRDEFLERYKGHYYVPESKDDAASAALDISGLDVEDMSGGQILKTVHKRDGSKWKPLEFPPIPKKGDFDVTRLKDSVYFFS